MPDVPAVRPVRHGPSARLDRRFSRQRQPAAGRAPRMSAPTVQTIEAIGGGVATPKGFRAAGVSAGIKAKAGALDLALLVSDLPATAAAVFTTNLAQAAPVTVSREHLARSGGVARAVVVNSGCANACTGEAGLSDARTMTDDTARLVGCPVEQVLVA